MFVKADTNKDTLASKMVAQPVPGKLDQDSTTKRTNNSGDNRECVCLDEWSKLAIEVFKKMV